MKRIEKAIIKTLIYSDIFDWPLKGWEVQKWLIGRSASLMEVEKGLGELVKRREIREVEGYYCLPRRNKIVAQRLVNQKVSQRFWQKARWLLMVLKLIPWIKMVAISGGLAMENVERGDDIDIVVVTARRRLWLSRLIVLGYLEVVGNRRRRGQKVQNTAGKICANTLLTIDGLAIEIDNIYLAHEVLQTRVLWERQGAYEQFLEKNLWAFEWLPNWRSAELRKVTKRLPQPANNQQGFLDVIEDWVKKWQLQIMGEPLGEEEIGDEALYFQPVNYQERVLSEYKNRLKAYR